MKKHIVVTPTTEMSPEDWIKFRKRGIGASEIGTVLGLNPYQSSIELFYDKIDPMPRINVQNMAMFMGHYHEDSIADLWQYWEGSQESIIANFQARKVVRRCRKINAYICNPNYPWLFASLDRIINKGNKGEEGALELKTIAEYEAKKWEAGIPMSHIVQVLDQMLIAEFSFGEVAALKDGRYFEVYPFEYNETICNTIIERTKAFWNRVEKGRSLMTVKFEAIRNFNVKLANEAHAEIEQLEPEPDGSEAYEKFMKDKYKKSLAEVGLVPGTEEDYVSAVFVKNAKISIKQIEDEMRLHENILRRRIGNNNKLDFGKNGYVSWMGEPRRFMVKLK